MGHVVVLTTTLKSRSPWSQNSPGALERSEKNAKKIEIRLGSTTLPTYYSTDRAVLLYNTRLCSQPSDPQPYVATWYYGIHVSILFSYCYYSAGEYDLKKLKGRFKQLRTRTIVISILRVRESLSYEVAL